MTVPYETALSVLESMFQGNVEKEVVAAILEANNGKMEQTVEFLLGMMNAETQENGEILGESNSGAVQEELPPLVPTPEETQLQEDEQFAKMVQDQLFLQELQQSSEFPALFPNGLLENNQMLMKIKQLGAGAKTKLQELAFKFTSTGTTPSNSENRSLLNEDDDAEVIAFDSSLITRLTNNVVVDATGENEDGEVPLEKSLRRRTNKVAAESTNGGNDEN